MNRDLKEYRKSYNKMILEEKDLPIQPIELFSKWFKEVEEDGGVEEANAMTVATHGLDGFPKTRIVLLKQYDAQGFIFYTNYNSEKGKAIAANNKVSISFFWPNLERQVIIKGEVSKIEQEKSEAYFNSRPKGSQLGAWTSDQSTVITSRRVLEDELKNLEELYKETPIPKPLFWGGYRVYPLEFEFWQGRPNRLHDRIRYQSVQDNKWKIDRLSP